MKKDCGLSLESLEKRSLLSGAPWFVDAIKVSEVWSQIGQISNKPVVAVVDSGLDLKHPEFQNNLWNNPYDKVDGIDNDNNGYVDDVNGWDFVQNDNSPQDGLFHGTHVAGIISQIVGNKAEIMPLRFQNDSGLGYAGAAASAIHYAVDMKLKGINLIAINCSFGGLDSMPAVLESAIRRADSNGILVVMAAGNNGVDMEIYPKYPASLKLTNSLTVSAVNSDLSLAGYSNYGKNIVDVGAPGSDIYSSLPNGSYGYVSGSSMASPMVSAEAALLKTLGSYSSSQIKNAILQGCDVLGDWIDKVGNGFINILKSWNILKNEKPQLSNVMVEQQKPPVVVVSPTRTIAYSFDVVSSKVIRGWARLSDGTKPIVEVYINNKLRYRVVADQYRGDTQRREGFVILMDKRVFKYGWNTLELRIKDPLSQLKAVIYKVKIRR